MSTTGNWERCSESDADILIDHLAFRLTHFEQWKYLSGRLHTIGPAIGIKTPDWRATGRRLAKEAIARGEKVPRQLRERL